MNVRFARFRRRRLVCAMAWIAASTWLPLVGGRLFAVEDVAVTPDVALKRLEEGNARFVAGKSLPSTKDAQRRTTVAQHQHPFAMVVCCSDSRVSPEVVFDQGLGDIFVVRSAGHVVDAVGLGSLEYAAEHLGAALIVVLGHERCGAVSAALSGAAAHGHIPAVLQAIQPAVEQVKTAQAQGASGDRLDNAVRTHVRQVVNQLRKAEPALSARVKSGKLKVVGARYDLDTGCVEILE